MPEHDHRDLQPGAEQPSADFDLLLRSSLETYGDPGPDSGLAERVLARIAAEGARQQARQTIRWAIALPVGACLIVVIVLAGLRGLHNAPVGANQARVTLPRSADTGRDEPIKNSPSLTARRSDFSRPERHSSRPAAAATVARLPKLDVFPTPQPLTPAEKELIAYVAHVPEAERQSLVEDEQRIDTPLTIAALEIQPIAPPEPQGN
ncbi:MAG: hypothetical protein ACLQHF_05440 [Terracidiphilus sp.]